MEGTGVFLSKRKQSRGKEKGGGTLLPPRVELFCQRKLPW